MSGFTHINNSRHGAQNLVPDYTKAHSEDASESSVGFSYRHRTTSVHRNFGMIHEGGDRGLDGGRFYQINHPSATLGRHQPLDKHVSEIVSKFAEDENLMADTQQAEHLRREALRDMPQGLTIKRRVKKDLTSTLRKNKKSKALACHKRFYYSISIYGTKIKTELYNLMYTFQLWYSILKTIEGKFGSAVATFFRFFRWLFILNVCTFIPCFFFIVLPQILETSSTHVDNLDFTMGDIFTGEGYFTDTILYYGFYSNATLAPFGEFQYVMPHAYFFTMLVIYFFNLIILSLSMARSYRKNFIETKGGLKNIFAHKIFAGWDYSIATDDAAKLKSSSIYHELKELMAELSKPEVKSKCIELFWTCSIQVIVNILSITLLCGLGYLLWILLDKASLRIIETDKASTDGIITAVVINAIMFVVPFVFSYITKVEQYNNPRITLYVALLRTFLLEVLIIGLLIMYWVLHTTSSCWETRLGQEIYRLVIFDFIFSIVFLLLTEVARSILYKHWKYIGSPSFDLARYTLQLTYNQTLFWVGLYFSPMLGALIILKLFLSWYMISGVIIYFCKPSPKTWRAAQTQTWFLIMTFISLMLVMAVLGYIMASKMTSKCGPFRHLEFVFDIIKLGILNMEKGHMVWVVILFFTKPGAIAIILLSMCMGAYYLRAKAQAQQGMVEFLRKMLITEAKDKEFLLKRISEVTKGQWQYHLHSNVMDPCRTCPSSYSSLVNRNRREFGDSLDTISSDLLLPSSSNSTFPSDEDNGSLSVHDRFRRIN